MCDSSVSRARWAGSGQCRETRQDSADDRIRKTGDVAELRRPEVQLIGQRISLRPFRGGDATDIAEACQDPNIPRFTFMPDHMTEAQAREWVERRLELWSQGLFSFAITLASDDRCLGQIGAHIEERFRRAETFYWLDSRVRGQGLATEALDLVTRWVFDEHEVVRAHLITHLDNQASQRVAQRCGYHREGVLRAWEPIKDDQPDVVMWSRLPSDPAGDAHST